MMTWKTKAKPFLDPMPQKQMSNLIKSIFVASLICAGELSSGSAGYAESVDVDKCGIEMNKTLRFVISRLSGSSNTSKIQLSCKDLTIMNTWREDKITLTTGRKNGRYTICISNDTNSPCEYVISTFVSTGVPADMLSDVFGMKVKQRSQLNETVERLFVNPSKLITR